MFNQPLKLSLGRRNIGASEFGITTPPINATQSVLRMKGYFKA